MKILIGRFSIVVATSWLAGCAGLPTNAPVEFSQAKEEIELAGNEDVEDVFGKTLERAQQTLDEAAQLYEEADAYKDPTAQGDKKKEATKQAVTAKNLASNARDAFRQVNSWDQDINIFMEKNALSSKLGKVEESLRGTASALQKSKAANEAQLRSTSGVAYFDTGKSELKSDGRQQVIEIAQTLKNNPSLDAHVIAFTDAKGSQTINQKIAAARANEVVQELVANGAQANQIKVRPYVVQRTNAAAGHSGQLQLERKVEIRLLPNGGQAE